jgi:hypothetical protein
MQHLLYMKLKLNFTNLYLMAFMIQTLGAKQKCIALYEINFIGKIYIITDM